MTRRARAERLAPGAPDAVERVTGRVELVLDVRLPGMAHARAVRSPCPHATIVSVDTATARRGPGVLAVLTGADLEGDPGVDPWFGVSRRDQPVLAIGRVRYVGDPVALVIAETARQASDAAEAVRVEYEERPAVVDPVDAGRPGAPVVHDGFPDNLCARSRLRRGDVEAAFARAFRVFDDTYTSPPASHVPLEPHVAVARFADGGLDVWTATQSPFQVRDALAAMFSLDPERVRVRVPNVGGGFGAKGGVKIEPMVACAARIVGRPVRMELTRDEVFLTLAKHAATVAIRTAVGTDGTILARAVEAVYDAGAYAISTPLLVAQAMTRAPGPYRIPNVSVDVVARYTNTVPTGPFRGSMTAQLVWAYESQLDDIAADLSIDPVDMRRRNLLVDGDAYATGESMHDVRFIDLVDGVAHAIEWDAPPPALSPNTAGAKGLAVMIKGTITPSRSEVRLDLDDHGVLHVFASTVELGQGARASIRQLAADELGLPGDRVAVVLADTAVTPYDLTTASSRSTSSTAVAIRAAAAELKCQLSELGASHLEVAAADLVHGGGAISVRGPGDPARIIPYMELLSVAGIGRLTADGVFQSEGGLPSLDPETGQGRASVHWHQGCVGVEVEVDLETGRVRVLRCHAASYAGRVVNALGVRQQNEGNVIFGLGPALFEELAYDGGQPLNPNLADYTIPSFLDLPELLTSTALERSDGAAEPHGLGEMTLPPVAAAIGNAIRRAVGVRIRDLPITPERVLRALEGATADGDASG